MRMVFPDLVSKNTFLLLYFNWTKDRLLLSKASDMFMLESLPTLDLRHELLAGPDSALLRAAPEASSATQRATAADSSALEELKEGYEARVKSLEAEVSRLKQENSKER